MQNILFISPLENFKELERVMKNKFFVAVIDSIKIANDWLADFDLVVFDSRLFDNLEEKNLYSEKEEMNLLERIKEYGMPSFFHPIDTESSFSIVGLKTRIGIELK